MRIAKLKTQKGKIMSYHTWTIIGYGISTDCMQTTADRLREYISQSPSLESKMRAVMTNYELADVDDILDAYHNGDYEKSGCVDEPGVAEIMADVMSETEDLNFTICNNFDSECFVLLEPSFPWLMTETERLLTEDGLKAIFAKHSAMLTNQSLEELGYDKQIVENGG